MHRWRLYWRTHFGIFSTNGETASCHFFLLQLTSRYRLCSNKVILIFFQTFRYKWRVFWSEEAWKSRCNTCPVFFCLSLSFFISYFTQSENFNKILPTRMPTHVFIWFHGYNYIIKSCCIPNVYDKYNFWQFYLKIPYKKGTSFAYSWSLFLELVPVFLS